MTKGHYFTGALLAGILAVQFLFGACASQMQAAGETYPSEALPPEEGETPPEGAALPAGDGLDSGSFRDLPPEAREYLKILAGAFRNRDREFLISQGESQYEKELRFRLDEESYLASLYRAGPYSEDSEWMLPRAFGPASPRLDLSAVRAIEYTDWEERGPMLEIRGRLYLQDGGPLPFEIVLVWRLPEPKILGWRP